MNRTGPAVLVVLMYLLIGCGTQAPEKPLASKSRIAQGVTQGASSDNIEEQEDNDNNEDQDELEDEAPSEEELAAQAAAQQALLFTQQAKQTYDMTCAGCHGEAAASNLNGRDPAITALTLMNAAGVVFHNNDVDAALPDSLEKGEGFLTYLADPIAVQ